MPDRLRFAIVGAGMMGREHMRNLKLFPDAAEVVALVDPHGPSIERAMKTLGAAGDIVRSPRVPRGQPKTPERRHVEVDAAALSAGAHHGATYFQLAAFLDAVSRQGPVQVTADDGLRTVEMGELGF
jgi:predicted dehydrogenase